MELLQLSDFTAWQPQVFPNPAVSESYWAASNLIQKGIAKWQK